MKEQKYHIYLTEQERSEVIKSLIDLKNALIRQGKYTDAVDDLLVLSRFMRKIICRLRLNEVSRQ